MLDPWIIKEILRREEEKRERIQIELPLDKPPREEGSSVAPQPTEEKRGVVVIDI